MLTHSAHPSCVAALERLYEGCSTATLQLHAGTFNFQWVHESGDHLAVHGHNVRHAYMRTLEQVVLHGDLQQSRALLLSAGLLRRNSFPGLLVLRHYSTLLQQQLPQVHAQAQLDEVWALIGDLIRSAGTAELGQMRMLFCRQVACRDAKQLFDLAYGDGSSCTVEDLAAVIHHPTPEGDELWPGVGDPRMFTLLPPVRRMLAWCLGLQQGWMQLPQLHLHCTGPETGERAIQWPPGRECIRKACCLLQVLCMFVQDVLLPSGHPSASVAAAVVKQWYLHGTSRLPGVHEGIMRWLVNGLVRACRWGGGIARPLDHVRKGINDNGLEQALDHVPVSRSRYRYVYEGAISCKNMAPSSLPVRRGCPELHRGRRVMLLSRTSRRMGR